MTKRVIVIGAGVAGLATGIRLLNEGFQVTIVEKGQIPGGKMSQINLDGYKFDLGPTIVMMPELYKEVFEMSGVNPDDYIPMTRIDPMYTSYMDEGHTVHTVTNDLVKTVEMFEAVNPGDGAGFLRYISDLYGRFEIARDFFLQRSFNTFSDFYNIKVLRQGLKLKTLNNAESLMKTYIKDKRMRQMISFQTLYIGISPEKGPSLYTIIPMIEFIYGIWFIDGGMRTMATGMARLFKEKGGVIEYDTTVEEIEISFNKATGVITDSGRIESDIVVCNADFPYAMKHLVKDAKYKGKYTDEKLDKMDYSCSCLVFYFGLDKKTEELETIHNFVFSNDLDENIRAIFDGDEIEDPSLYAYIASKIDPSLAPVGTDGVYVLMPISNTQAMKYEWTEETVQNYRRRVISKISKLPGLEDFEDSIVTETYVDPKIFENQFNAYNGATFGLMPTLTQSNHLRPQAKAPNVEHLYFTGSSTHPGAGVPIVLLSAKIAVAEILKHERD